MKELVEQSVQMFRWTLTEANIDFDMDVQSSMLLINGSSITQVISNLLDNAIRHYEGEGTIEMKGLELAGEYRFSVTGPGKPISSNEQDKLFERFYRIDDARSRDSGGSGLGLAISKEIIELHQGKIGVTSEGDVHTFWFSLPRDGAR